MNPGQPAGGFAVRMMRDAREVVLQLLDRARRYGVQARFEAELLAIEAALAAGPVAWGEPVRRYKAARLMVYHRVHDQLHVVYAVHEQARLVWVLSVEPVLGHPLRVATE